MKTEPNRHEQVRTTPGTLSVQAAVKKGLNNKKIRYIKGSHSSELIPGKIHRARVAYRKANGYAAKKHSRFHEFVDKWLQKNRMTCSLNFFPNHFFIAPPKDEIYGEKLLRFGTAEVECFPHKVKCYFGERTVYLSSWKTVWKLLNSSLSLIQTYTATIFSYHSFKVCANEFTLWTVQIIYFNKNQKL